MLRVRIRVRLGLGSGLRVEGVRLRPMSQDTATMARAVPRTYNAQHLSTKCCAIGGIWGRAEWRHMGAYGGGQNGGRMKSAQFGVQVIWHSADKLGIQMPYNPDPDPLTLIP